MKVNSEDMFFGNQSQLNMVQKIITQFKAGDKFSAVICDIKPDAVSLRLSDDSILNAKSLIIPDARIGQSATFVVKENMSGQILIEIEKGNEGSPNFNFIKEMLLNAELPTTKENIDFVNDLILKNVDINKNTLQKAIYFKYSDTEMTMDKLLFLINEDFPAKKVSIDVLENILNDKQSFKNNLINIAEEITSLPDGITKDELLELFSISKDTKLDKKSLYNSIVNKLFTRLNNKEKLSELNNYFQRLFETCEKGEKILLKDENSKSLLKDSFENVKETIKFMDNINSYKEYIQIPFNFNDRKQQCEVYIFKKHKNEKKVNSNSSILISLDCAFIGYVEAFINKESRNLSFQFKVKKENTLKIIKSNINKLLNPLKQKGYNVLNIDFKIIQQQEFNILKDKIQDNNVLENKNATKRYSFDMRV